MFANRVTDTVTIGDVVVTIQKLSWKKLRRAAEIKNDNDLMTASKAGPGIVQGFAEAAKLRAAAPGTQRVLTLAERQEARYAEFETGSVLRSGIVKWTAEEQLSDAVLDELDEDVAVKLHRAILDLSLPPLDAQQVEGDRKNG